VSDTSSCHGACEGRVAGLVATVQRNVEISKSYSTGKLDDESLSIYKIQQKNAGTWLVMLSIVAAFLIVQFALSFRGHEPALQYIWFLVIDGFFMFVHISSFLRYRRLIKNREQVQAIWHSR
jgi:hypothetical protein